MKRWIIYLFALGGLYGEEELRAPPKDRTKEYREQYYFHYDFYVDDEGEEADSVKTILKSGRPYEGDIGVIIDELTRSGSVAIDCGSHIGVHTVTMSKKVGAQGKVIAFEPNRKLHCEQLYNLELNGCNNVTSICKAAGCREETVFLKWGKIDAVDLDRGYFVDAVPIDSYKLENVSLIKMDVENYEYPVLLGAQETIARNKPIVIFECWLNCNYCDVTHEEQKQNFLKVASLFESMGYEIRIIHSCNFIAFPLEIKFPFSIYREKFPKLDVDTYNPDLFVPPGNGIQYYRSWTAFE